LSPTVVFDFDSTLVQFESFPELARISLKNHPERADRLAEIERITELTASGGMSMVKGIALRIGLLDGHRKHLEKLARSLKRSITPSVKRNRAFFKKYRDQIYVVSNGFRELILPVTKTLGIRENHVFANAFLYGEDGRIIGFDKANPLARQDGKARLVKSLKLEGELIVIGDGFSDYKIKQGGQATRFYAFTENVRREEVAKRADHVLPSLDEFLYINKFPMSLSYPKTRIRVLLLENIHPRAAEQFEREGYSVIQLPVSLSEEELIKELEGVALIGIRSRTQITRRALDAADKLKGIGAFCIGTNQIDLDACARRGVIVFNAPYANTRSVVELAIGEIVMLARRIFDKSTELHRGLWIKSAAGCFEVRGKKLGIVGYGNIGSQLSVLAEAMGLDVYYYDIVEKLPLGNATKCGSLEELLKKVDIVSVHVDGRNSNRDLFGDKQFRLLKDGALFLNLSRGFVVNAASLAKAIESRKLGGTAVDVYPEEPTASHPSFHTILQGLPNVILTPHIGGSTQEALENIARFVSRALIDFVNTGSSFMSVNFPNVQLPDLRRAHRFVHIHSNEPGVLAAINQVMADNKVNILGQYLKTDERIGYVITDVSKKYQPRIVEELKKVPHTIKFRVLY
jgi:D-3-phosphoglycerate dehydrogenase